jgi:hypothetical protein
MSDLAGLHGVFPTSIRWNAEDGVLGVSVFNPESGERKLQEIELGQPATFAMDLATRMRGYGLIRTGVYDMRLTPVGSPLPPWPNDDDFKVAIGIWLWNPTVGEVRLETNGSIVRQAITGIWDQARSEPQAAAGLQPVVSFVNRVPVPVKALNKTFQGPAIRIVGWVERDKIPGWSERPPTVLPPKTLTALSTAAAVPAIETTAKGAKPKTKSKTKARAADNDPSDSLDNLLGDDPIPYA